MEEKSHNTIKKYMRDIHTFLKYIGKNTEITKELVISYKEFLAETYELSSANSMLASLNSFFQKNGWYELKVHAYKLQRQMYRSNQRDLNKEEYNHLLQAAKKKGKTWLYAVMVTICSTGIRVSELPFITVQAVCTRQAKVTLKGKSRTVILSQDLCKILRQYIKEREISSGSIFVTRTGKNIDRCNIYHAMRALSVEAEVEKSKIFPHNLRHLFAVTYYKMSGNIVHLADILGHSNINTTRIYTLVSLEEHENQIESMGLVV